MSKKIFVGNLNFRLSNDGFRDMFSQFGDIEDCVIITDRDTRRSKGFGFITFVEDAAADKAVTEMNEKEVEGRPLTVNIAKPREER